MSDDWLTDLSSKIAANAKENADREDLVEVHLVPVTIDADSYGLSDSVQPWSDCNRAHKHLFRKDDEINKLYREPGDTIKIYVPRNELHKFEQNYD